jgi:hypothetical protein
MEKWHQIQPGAHHRLRFSPKLRNEVRDAVAAVFHASGLVNPVLLGERLRQRNVLENVALEDIVYAIVAQAQLLGVPVEFDGNGKDTAWPEMAAIAEPMAERLEPN